MVLFIERLIELKEIFEKVEENQKKLILPLVEEVVFLEIQMKSLKELPFIRIHPQNKSKQEQTPAFKQYKELSQSYMNAIRILCSILNKTSSDDYDPVAEFMEKMQNG